MNPYEVVTDRLSAQRRRGYHQDLPKRQNQQVIQTATDNAWRQARPVYHPPRLVRWCRDPSATSFGWHVVARALETTSWDPGALDQSTRPSLLAAAGAAHN